FQSLEIYREYIDTLLSIVHHKDPRPIRKLCAFLTIVTLKSLHQILIAFAPLTPIERAIHFDAVFIIAHNSLLNVIWCFVGFLHLYMSFRFFHTSNWLNNKLLQDILFRHETRFFIKSPRQKSREQPI